MKHKYFYLERTVAHLDDMNLATLYVEGHFNRYDEWVVGLLACELARRPAGLDALLVVEINLYKRGLFDACWPLHVAVLIEFSKRGKIEDVVLTLVENQNLSNAVKMVAAGCDWLTMEEVTDETIGLVADMFKAAVNKK